MRLRRFLAVLGARNKEFARDRATLGWALAFPMLVLLGMAFIFGGRGELGFRIAVLDLRAADGAGDSGGGDRDGAAVDLAGHGLDPFFASESVTAIAVTDGAEALDALRRHGYDMVLDLGRPRRYWVNASSAKGQLLERLLLSRAAPPPMADAADGAAATAESSRPEDEARFSGAAAGAQRFERGTVAGRQVRYVEWLLPGMLGLNAMFGCLFGVGFVIVRYRKNGVLRRLKATPLTAFEFLSAQVVSRLFLVLATTALVYAGTDLLLGFRMEGSYLDLVAVFTLGTFSLIALALVFAARTASEELAGGLLNVATWPMMLLGGVWFSLDGSPRWVRAIGDALPLTHLVAATRSVMIEGATLGELTPHLLYLAAASVAFLALGSTLFRWE